MQITAFNTSARQKVARTFAIATEEVQRSLVEGSEITGSQGQPVDEFVLRPSFIPEFLTPSTWQITTDKLYAKFIEQGGNSFGPFTLRSKVGGFHSKELTRTGWPAIVRFAAEQAGARV